MSFLKPSTFFSHPASLLLKDFHPFRGDRFADWTGQDLKGNNDLLMLTQPSIVCEVYSKFIAAWSDIIETNTFNAITISQKDYGLGHLVPELNLAAARLPLRVGC